MFAAVGAAAAVAVGAVVGVASPAAAGTCGTPGCGGTVVNQGSAAPIRVANQWCWTALQRFVGPELECVKNHDSWAAREADAWLALGESSSAKSAYYYDVDAFMVRGGCRTTFYYGDAVAKPRTEAPGSDMWIRITGTTRVSVTRVAC
ncbi:hypothetical protein SAMN05444365_105285 [Micromonospora pattaloongensis]|uniref:Peptidase inhibitor family I36 n=2 Tax=Micromonospora pattaloongensis TaxID=405436 RepID=A0A1H3Q866_9ACTN|nr:hypothetical protein SAMN05444365_105285 [Micromonospora pattaloongensis]